MLRPNSGCPRCGNPARGGARYCDACGTPLPRAEAGSFDTLLESELKYATALFADIAASTSMVVGRSPDEARAFLAPVVALMMDAALAFGGTINHVLGDGVMALFGAPFSQEDHALRACCAALRMHEKAVMLPASHRLRIGLASGQMLLGGPGAGAAGAYQAFGATLHLASRLQTMAQPGTTLCDDTTRVLAGPGIEVVEMGAQPLRGFGVEQPVFIVTAAGQSRSAFPRSSAGDLSPLVGRDRELAELDRWSQVVLQGGSYAGAIVGDAGLGKSRLAWEFTRSLPPGAWQVFRAEAVSYGRDVPYHFVATLLRTCLGIEERDEPARAAERVRSRLVELTSTADSAPALLSLLSLPLGRDAAVWDGLDPTRRREALRDSLRTLLHALCRCRPTLVLLEDLQWVDEESLRLLDIPPAPDSRLLLLVTHRPAFATDWGRPIDTVVHLRPLPPDSIDRLITDAFPDLGGPELRRALIERAAGNPFFLEELARDALVATVPRHGARSPIPATIHAVIAARIDRLPAEDKRLLVMAAVLGSRFPRRMLRAMCGDVPDDEFEPRLARLFAADMLRPLAQPGTELAFVHALIQEVAYAAVPGGQRRDLHRQIVRTMQRIDQERLAEQAETLAYHAAIGECWEEMVFAASVAGRRAASRSAYAEAARFLGQAIEACDKLPQTPEALNTQIDLRFDLRQAIGVTAGISGSLENSKKALRLARRLGERRRLAWAAAFVARDLQLVGQPIAAIKVAARALALAEGDAELALVVRYFAGQANYSRGEYVRTVEILRTLTAELGRGEPVAWKVTLGPPIVFFQAWLIWSLARLGDTEESLAVAHDMRQLGEASSLPLCRMLADLSEGFALAFAGRLPEAERVLTAGLSLCREWGFVAWSTNISSCLGHVLARLGRFDEAFEHLHRAIDVTRRSGILVSHANELAWLAEAHLLQGSAAEAARISEEAVKVAQRHQERGNEALASLVLGEALMAQGEAVAARARFAQSLRLATDSRMAPLIERCEARLRAIDAEAAGEARPLDMLDQR